MMRLPATLLSTIVLIIPVGTSIASTNDFHLTVHYASSGELKAELAQRRRDLARTETRLSDLIEKEQRGLKTLFIAREHDKKAETAAMERARIYYRITRQGGSLQYLLNARSIVEMLKRGALLKRLLIEGLEARREAGLRIASAEQKLASIRTEKEAAKKMLAMLGRTIEELSSELKEN